GAVQPTARPRWLARLDQRPNFAIAAFSQSYGSACTVLPLMPVMVSAFINALSTDSSVASTTAWNKGLSVAVDSGETKVADSVRELAACGMLFPVENAMKMSPLVLPEVDPVRARPSDARAARRSSCRDDSGASVATTTITEPSWSTLMSA